MKVKERFSYFLYKDAELVSLISWKGELLLKILSYSRKCI